MRSKSSDKCMTDMYPPSLMCGPNMVSVGCKATWKPTQKLDVNIGKSVDHKNEVKGDTCLADMYPPCVDQIW